ncbi:hypothetical protein IAT38_006631 [Cryptococcus sp. DSM 104549]
MASYHDNGTVPSWDSFENDKGEEEVDNSEYTFAGRDHILFCIDASESMHTPFPDEDNTKGKIRGRSALQQALEAIEKIQRSKVITGPMDSVGVVMWNVDKFKAPLPTSPTAYKDGTYVYQPVRQINPEEIKRLVDLNQQARDQIEFQDEDDAPVTTEPEILRESFPPVKKEDELSIGDVLATCNFMFRDAGTNVVGAKRVFLITDADEPRGSSQTRGPTKIIFGDLRTYGIDVIPFFISRPEHQFDPNLVWNDILNRSPEDTVEYDGLQELTDMINDLVIKYAPKRAMFNVPLKMGKGGDIVIGVSGYALISAVNKGQPKLVSMRGRKTQYAQVRSEYTAAETGAVLRESELGQAYQFGHEKTIRNVLEPNWWEAADQAVGEELVDEALTRDKERRQQEDEDEDGFEDDEEPEEGEDGDVTMEEVKPKTTGASSRGKEKVVVKTRIHYSSDEVAKFKSMGLEPQIKIIGFQGSNHLHPDENVKHAYFIYPNESEYTGSTRTFTALLLSCIKHDRHALALCRFRTNTVPEFCVLIPQPEVLNDDGSQEMPPGFHVIPLPYKDDLRKAPKAIRSTLSATEEQLKVMGAILRVIRSKSYESDSYPNPALAYHFDQLQALAFGEDWDPDAPEKQDLDKTKPKWNKIHAAAGEFMEEWNRLIEEDERAVVKLVPASKRTAKAVVQVDEEDLLDIPGMWKKGSMDKLRVQELKDWAKFHELGISLTGKTKKSDIIDTMTAWLEQHSSELGKKTKT